MAVADTIAARMNSIVAEAGDDVPAEAEAAPEVVAETPVVETETETEAVELTPEQTEAKERAARVALFEEKLKASREKRQSQRLAEQARADRVAAKAERDAAQAEAAKYSKLKTGSFKEALETLGRDPRKTYEDMQREAIEASTPEAEQRRDKAALEERLAKQQERLDALEKEREDARMSQAEQAKADRMAASLSHVVADPAFTELRVQYPEGVLLNHVQYWDKHPAELVAHAKSLNVPLTDPRQGFTMRELLQVLAAAQAAHDDGAQKRRAALAPSEPQSASPTVNGTAPRRNAATAVGNDLASTRASGAPAVSGSARERIRQRIEMEASKAGR